MSIGDKPINAQTITEIIPETKTTYEQVKTTEIHGLTYREWLIGMLASNPEFMVGASPDRMAVLPTKSAEWIIAQADAIIKQLDKESDNEKG